MKQADVMIDYEYLTRINGKLCRVRVRVTAKREAPGWIKGARSKTIFDWVRVDPPANARVLRGADTAASLHHVKGKAS